MAGDEGSAKRPYHHGDLGRALVAAAARIIEEGGVDALTLRGVGAAVGVSRTAIYRHFADKASLLGRVKLEGFRMFREALEASIRDASGGTEPIVELAGAYARFAADHPAYFSIMFEEDGGSFDEPPGPDNEGSRAFGLLVGAIAEGQRAGRLAGGDPIALATVSWSTTHGVVALARSGRLGIGSGGFGPVDAVAIARSAAEVLIAGLGARGGLEPGGAGGR